MKKVVFATCSIALVAGVYLAIDGFSAPNRAIVRNSSGGDATNVTLVLEDLSGTWRAEESAVVLKSGDALTLRHGKNDTRARLTYTLNGVLRHHEEAYIDLWTGQSWIFDIQPNGRVEAGYGSALGN